MNPQPPLTSIVEALIFASPEPITTAELVRAVRTAAAAVARAATAGPDDDDGSDTETGDVASLGAAADAALRDNAAATAAMEAEGGHEVEAPDDEGPGTGDSEADVFDDPRPWPELAKVTEEEVADAIRQLVDHYAESRRAFTLEERVNGWRIFTRPELGPWVRGLFPERKAQRLSAPALETLAIIAYRQPITKAAIEAVRGVSIDGPLQKLLDQNVIRIGGRADLPGRPLLYETTGLFFENFGIKSVDDLPNSTELRRINLPQPPEPEVAPAGPEVAADTTPGGESGDGAAADTSASTQPTP